ncbi:hypothetical protein CYMTET_34559 [Cymbomonas tetramitiformis]|uniref:alpha-galactosidase n=1 Tax=Cymbomonas tetramitiformis TaxID=36881 RepID=A0AAE0FBF1_9CHLO|nr:hypothetical protein CYMTET_34559 [Cymbomonas tetramitiformis]
MGIGTCPVGLFLATFLQGGSSQEGRRATGVPEVWYGPLSSGAVAVVLFNRNNVSSAMEVAWTDIDLDLQQPMLVRDLWTHQDLGKFRGRFTTKLPIPVHGVQMLKLSPIPNESNTISLAQQAGTMQSDVQSTAAPTIDCCTLCEGGCIDGHYACTDCDPYSGCPVGGCLDSCCHKDTTSLLR